MLTKVGDRSLREASIEVYPERANLYPLTIDPVPSRLFLVETVAGNKTQQDIFFDQIDGSKEVEPYEKYLRSAITRSLDDALKTSGYRARKSKIIKTETNFAPEVAKKSLALLSSFDYRVICFGGKYYLCLDHRLIVRAKLTFKRILALLPDFTAGSFQRVFYRNENQEWIEAKLISHSSEIAQVEKESGDGAVIECKDLIPDLTHSQVMQLAPKLNTSSQVLERLIKQYSFLTASNAPLARLSACTKFAAELMFKVFPIPDSEFVIELEPSPVVLRPPSFITGMKLTEPHVTFDHINKNNRSKDILAGLVAYGAYDKPSSKLRIALITTTNSEIPMKLMFQRLNSGKYNYKGASKTFGSEFQITKTLACKNASEYIDSLREFVRTPEGKATDVALVYLPKEGNVFDPNHP